MSTKQTEHKERTEAALSMKCIPSQHKQQNLQLDCKNMWLVCAASAVTTTSNQWHTAVVRSRRREEEYLVATTAATAIVPAVSPWAAADPAPAAAAHVDRLSLTVPVWRRLVVPVPLSVTVPRAVPVVTLPAVWSATLPLTVTVPRTATITAAAAAPETVNNTEIISGKYIPFPPLQIKNPNSRKLDIRIITRSQWLKHTIPHNIHFQYNL